MQHVRHASLGKHFELIYLQFLSCLTNLLRFVRFVKNVIAGHTNVNITNRATAWTREDLLSIGMNMKSTAFGTNVSQCFWFWDMIQLLCDSNVKCTFVRRKGLVSNTCALERISSSFNYSTHRNKICSTTYFDSVIFNSAIRDDIMIFSSGYINAEALAHWKLRVKYKCLHVFLSL